MIPSIPSILNNHFNTCTEITNELDLYIDDSSNFFDSIKKDKAVNYANSSSSWHAKESNAAAHHALVNLDREEISCRMPKL